MKSDRTITWEVFWEEKSEYNCNKSNPLPNVSTDNIEEKVTLKPMQTIDLSVV